MERKEEPSLTFKPKQLCLGQTVPGDSRIKTALLISSAETNSSEDSVVIN